MTVRIGPGDSRLVRMPEHCPWTTHSPGLPRAVTPSPSASRRWSGAPTALARGGTYLRNSPWLTSSPHRNRAGAPWNRVGLPPRSGGAGLVLAGASARTSGQTEIEPERITDPVATVGNLAGHVGVVGEHDLLLIECLNADTDHSAGLRYPGASGRIPISCCRLETGALSLAQATGPPRRPPDQGRPRPPVDNKWEPE